MWARASSLSIYNLNHLFTPSEEIAHRTLRSLYYIAPHSRKMNLDAVVIGWRSSAGHVSVLDVISPAILPLKSNHGQHLPSLIDIQNGTRKVGSSNPTVLG